MIVEFSIVPMGAGASVSVQLARVLKLVADSGIPYRANPMGTVVEGEWDEVLALVRKCHAEVMQDVERAVTSIRIDDRKGGGSRIDKKLDSVERKLRIKLNR